MPTRPPLLSPLGRDPPRCPRLYVRPVPSPTVPPGGLSRQKISSHGNISSSVSRQQISSHGRSKDPLTAEHQASSHGRLSHGRIRMFDSISKTKPTGLSRQKSKNPEGGALDVGEGGTTRSGGTLGGRGALAHSVGRRCRGRDAHGDPVWGIGFHGGVQHPGVQH